MCTLCAAAQPLIFACPLAGLPDFAATAATQTEGLDAAGGTSTVYTLQSGDSFSGAISLPGDDDWVRLTLSTGEHEVSLRGDTLADPYLRVYDGGGNLIGESDDLGPADPDSGILLTITGTVTLYLSARAADGVSTGSYTIDINGGDQQPPADPQPSGDLDALAAYLIDGYWTDTAQDSHSFALAPGAAISVNLAALTAEEQKLARWALEAWTAVADLRFSETTGPAQITFTNDQPGAYTTYTTLGGATTSATVNITSNWLTLHGATIDSYAFQTYVHEIGHALGIGHLGNYDGNGIYGEDETFGNDSWQVSVMSYFSQTQNTLIDADFARPTGPMIADVLAMQTLYGAPGAGTLTAGDTVFGVGHTLGGSWLGLVFDGMNGSGTPASWSNDPAAFTIVDAGGHDRIDFSNDQQAQVVDLRPEGVSDVYGLTGNLLIARGTVIEDYTAGAGDDRVTGNAADNRLAGGAGDDRLSGGDGDDWLAG
ncbi:MAG: M10 family metallopeptidase, partial [Rhodovulum sp.]